MTDTSNYIYKEASKLFDKELKSYAEKDYFTLRYDKYILVINTINGIQVLCKFIISKIKNVNKIEYNCYIIIESEKIFIGESMNNYQLYFLSESIKKFSPKCINDFLLKFKNIIPKLVIDKYEGKLINCEEKKSVFEDEKYFGYDIFGIEFDNHSECVICYENTKTITSCNHNLCIDCWNNLTTDLCPICRECLSVKNDEE